MKKYSSTLLFVFVAAVFFISGCSPKPSPVPDAPAKTSIGIIDLQKAAEAHPQYKDLAKLRKEYETLRQQLEQVSLVPSSSLTEDGNAGLTGLKNAQEQEFNSRMAEKQAEAQERFQAKAKAINTELDTLLQQYTQELDKEYQSKIFSLQLKLKTVQLNKEDAEVVQKELETIQKERADKIAAKEQGISAEMDAKLATERAAFEKELTAFAGDLNSELAKRSRESVPPVAANEPVSASAGTRQNLIQQMDKKQSDIVALQDTIMKDIVDKTAVVALEKKLDAVLANIRINVSAEDVTQAVVAGFKK